MCPPSHTLAITEPTQPSYFWVRAKIRDTPLALSTKFCEWHLIRTRTPWTLAVVLGKAVSINSLRPIQNGRHYADDALKRFFLNGNVSISIQISLKFVPKGPFNNIPALDQKMAWRLPGDKPLYEPMVVSLLTHICVARLQWVKSTILIEVISDWPDAYFSAYHIYGHYA